MEGRVRQALNLAISVSPSVFDGNMLPIMSFLLFKGEKIKQNYSPFIHVFERAGWCSNSREELATNNFQVAPKTFNPVTKRWYQCGIQSRQSIFLLYIEPENSVPHTFDGIQS